jgi:RND superfamily putative drug exporter
MELLGDKNWWIPRWLDRILPHINVEPTDQLDAELAELDTQSRSRV